MSSLARKFRRENQRHYEKEIFLFTDIPPVTFDLNTPLAELEQHQRQFAIAHKKYTALADAQPERGER